jgi:cytochrome c5
MRLSFARAAVLSFGTAAAMLAAVAPAAAADGKAVYEKTCALCHAAGVANAPKFGDKAAWAPRVATGKAVLVASVKAGKGAMPPKAGASDLKDDDIQAAVDYLLAAAK